MIYINKWVYTSSARTTKNTSRVLDKGKYTNAYGDESSSFWISN